MKLIQHYKKVILMVVLVTISACSSEDHLTASILDTTKPHQSELDVWIEKSYPYAEAC